MKADKKVALCSGAFTSHPIMGGGPSTSFKDEDAEAHVTCPTHISSVQLFSCVQLFATSWTAARQASLSITSSWSLLKLISIESVIPLNHLIFVVPFSSCLQSFPASGSFPMSQLFPSDGQSFGDSASASVLPMNIQD